MPEPKKKGNSIAYIAFEIVRSPRTFWALSVLLTFFLFLLHFFLNAERCFVADDEPEPKKSDQPSVPS